LQPLDNVPRVAHVGADRAAESLTVDRGQMNARISQRFGGRLAAQGNILQLSREFSLDINRRAEQQAIRYARHTRQAAHAAVASLHCFPNGVAVSADRRDHADARNNDHFVLGMGRLH
jgi:hypothetical protein